MTPHANWPDVAMAAVVFLGIALLICLQIRRDYLALLAEEEEDDDA